LNPGAIKIQYRYLVSLLSEKRIEQIYLPGIAQAGNAIRQSLPAENRKILIALIHETIHTT